MTETDASLVAVTGAGGFVGGAIARRLLANGFRVRALSSGRGGPPPAGVEPCPLPAPGAPAAEFTAALRGAAHLVHAAALNNADRRLGDAAYRAPNVELTGRLAEAAAGELSGRMVFISSIRAAAGPLFSGTIDEAMTAEPGDAYGRSKREGELQALAAYAGRPDLAVLRLPPVYGPGMKGRLGALLRLADSPWPLPLRNLPGRRSLLDVEQAASAVLHLLACPVPPAPVLVASDAGAPTLGEVAAAFRDGLGRPRRLLAAPVGLLGRAAGLAGRGNAWRALTASQICDPAVLAASGWAPAADSRPRLAHAACQSRRAG